MKPISLLRAWTFLSLFLMFTPVAHATKLPPTSQGAYFSGERSPGSSVSFTGSGSFDNDNQHELGYTPRYKWDFDYQGGVFTQDTSTTSTLISHTYTQTGTYTVAIVYVDDDNQEGSVYTFPIAITDLKRYYYLTDHLGSIRATVKAGKILVADDFSGDLSKWQLVKGSEFSLSSGTLQHGPSGSGEAIRVNSSSEVMTDGIFSSSIKWSGIAGAGPGVIVRYQDNNNFYWVDATTSTLYLKERVAGVDSLRKSISASMASGTWYTLTVTVEGATIRVARNGSELLSWSGATRWESGRVGVHYSFQPSKAVYWDNITVTTGGPGQVVSADDYDAWGMVLEGRSINTGDSQARYKFLAKEHDTETGYEWLEARGYDARIGRFLVVDPLAEMFPNMGPYTYAHDNPIAWSDPSGLADSAKIRVKNGNITVDEVVICAEDLSPKGFKGSYDRGEHRLRYQADEQTTMVLRGRDWNAFLADALRSGVYTASLEGVTPDEVHALGGAYGGNVSPLVQRLTNMLIEKLAKSGVAVTPLIQAWGLSFVVSFLSAQNPVAPQLPTDYRHGAEADTSVYDPAHGDMIMQVFYKNLRDTDSSLVNAVYKY